MNTASLIGLLSLTTLGVALAIAIVMWSRARRSQRKRGKISEESVADKIIPR